MYTVKEMFFTIQGEGYNYGKHAVFCRFTGCNLWSGLEKDRAKAICKFCDTDFIGTNGKNGKKFKNADEITDKVLSIWKTKNKPFVVLTGGEPMLQVNNELINSLHKKMINNNIANSILLSGAKGIGKTTLIFNLITKTFETFVIPGLLHESVKITDTSGNTGDATNTAPSGDRDIVRIIGYNLGASGEIYFNPDNTWVEVNA